MTKFSLDSSYVETLAKLLREYDLREISLGNESSRVTLKRGEKVVYGSSPAPVAAVAAAVAPQPDSAAAKEGGAQAVADEGVVVSAPIVGTVYLASSPTTAPFVKVGSKVKEGQTLLIVEAMKIMNQIPAPCSGTVVKLHVENAQPVEYGDALIVIDPS